jgi:hypothetical protein
MSNILSNKIFNFFSKGEFPPILMSEMISLIIKDKEVIYVGMKNEAENIKKTYTFCKEFNFNMIIMEDNNNKNHINLIIGLNKKLVTKLYKILHGDADPKEVGIILGYPECCIQSYSKWKGKNSIIKYVLSNTKNIIQKFPFYTNNLFNFSSRSYINHKLLSEFMKTNNHLFPYLDFSSIISWHPCSYYCSKSIKRGKKIYEFMKIYLPKMAESKKQILSSTFLFLDDFEFLVVKGNENIKNNNIMFELNEMLPYPKTLTSNKVISKLKKGIIIKANKKRFILEPNILKNYLLISFE